MKSRKDSDRIENLAETFELLSETIDLFILFIDLCDSSEIKQYCRDNEIPDITWISRQKIFLSRVSTIILSYEGSIIKTIGDEVMATFSIKTLPDKIVKCVIEIFQTFENLHSFNKGKYKIYSKASIDFGPCYDGRILIQEIFDPIGNCVDRCARLNNFAGKNEIVVSSEFNDILDYEYSLKNQFDIIEYNEVLKGIGKTRFFKMIFKNP